MAASEELVANTCVTLDQQTTQCFLLMSLDRKLI